MLKKNETQDEELLVTKDPGQEKVDGHVDTFAATSKNQEQDISQELGQTEAAADENEIMAELEAERKRKTKLKQVKSTAILWAKRIWDVSVLTLGVLLMLLCLSNLYQNLFNQSQYTGFFGVGQAVVASPSMEPKIKVNDLIFYKSIDPQQINIGDVVVYKKNASDNKEILVVHEVIEIGDGYVTTQGINNAIPDEAFPTSAIVGKYVFKIDGIGAFLSLFSTIWAPIIVVIILIAIAVLRVVFYYIKKKNTIRHISHDSETQIAIDYFFEL